MTQATKTSRGFTLIELLTVIAIIGILAGLIIPTVNIIQQRAQETATRTRYSQWASAIEEFFKTYGYYPTFGVTASSDTVVDLSNAATRDIFVDVMQGTEDTTGGGTVYNRKKIRFYSFTEDEFNDADELADTFGNSNIRVVVDSNRDGEIADTALSDLVEPPTDPIRASVLIFSVEGDAGPEIKSWE